MKGTIYLIRNLLNDKGYIGQTKQTIKQRMKDHFRTDNDMLIGRAINKYGKSAFEVIILSDNIESQIELDRLEIEYIKQFNTLTPNGYNLTTGGFGGNGIRKINETEDQRIVQLYKSGKSKNEIASLYDVYPGTIDRILSKYDVSIRTNRQCRQAIPDEELDSVIKLYDETKSLNIVAMKYNCSNSAVLRFLRFHNIDRKTDRGKQKVNLSKDEFIDLYNKYKTNKALSEILGVKDNTITYYKKKYGLPCKNTRNKE